VGDSTEVAGFFWVSSGGCDVACELVVEGVDPHAATTNRPTRIKALVARLMIPSLFNATASIILAADEKLLAATGNASCVPN
jgi:hypothetical protein